MPDLSFAVATAEKLFREDRVEDAYNQLRVASGLLTELMAEHTDLPFTFNWQRPDQLNVERVRTILDKGQMPRHVAESIITSLTRASRDDVDAETIASDVNAYREAIFWYLGMFHVGYHHDNEDITPLSLTVDEDEFYDGTSQYDRKVFLCYATEDRPHVETVYKRLKARGHSPWMDVFDLLPGQEWNRELARVIRSCDYFIACLSPHSVNKRGFVQKEIRRALDVLDEMPFGKQFLIPLLLDSCRIPIELEHLQWLEITSIDAYDKLFYVIETPTDEEIKAFDAKLERERQEAKPRTRKPLAPPDPPDTAEESRDVGFMRGFGDGF